MNRQLTRLAGTFAGLVLAVSVAMPALAAGTDAAHSGARSAPSSDLGRSRCLDVRLAVRTDQTVAHLKAFGLCEVDRRLATIDRLQGAIGNADVLTDDHAAALRKILADSESGLKALRAEIADDTTVPELTEDIRRIFSEYRIYALVTRQVVLVRADDRVDAAAARLTHASEQLTAAIERAAGNGKDVTEAQGHLDAMLAAISAAKSEVAGDAAAVLAQTPTTWNTGAAKPILDAARASISAAHTDLRTALTEARAVMAALR
ncbi:MAG: hypothetical protein ABI598_02000 [Chloroflexota bacterium]